MRIIRFLLEMIVVPIMLITTVIQWFGAFIIGFASIVFNVLFGLFLLVGLPAGIEAVKMIVAGFIVFMIPVAGEWIVIDITVLNMRMRNFIKS